MTTNEDPMPDPRPDIVDEVADEVGRGRIVGPTVDLPGLAGGVVIRAAHGGGITARLVDQGYRCTPSGPGHVIVRRSEDDPGASAQSDEANPVRTPADHRADYPDCPVCDAEGAQLDRLVERVGQVADAAVVVDGSADDLVAKLVDDGWTWDGTAESVAGKRLRVLVPPPGWTGSADPAG